MFRYADPTACPGCRAPLEYGAAQCPACGLELAGEPAQRLFTTLSQADALLEQMRRNQAALRQRVPATVGGMPAARSSAPGGDLPTVPAGAPALSAASVPRILLGLGALCLLVAAMVFLAVAWAALGVGGRTGVLVVLTTSAAGAGAWLARRDLRAGAESFVAVALGLVVLDLVGARNAGWLGDPTDPGFLVVLGSVLGGASLAAALVARRTPVAQLAAAELAAALGALVVGFGLVLSETLQGEPGLVLALLVAAALTGFADQARLRVASWAGAAVTTLWWAGLVAAGLARLSEPTFADVWSDLDAWPMLVAAATAGIAATLARLPEPARVVAASAAVALATYLACVVAFDESRTTVALVELAVVAVAALASVRLAMPWRWVTVAPSAAAGLGLAVSSLMLLSEALESLLDFTPWQVDVTAGVAAPEVPWTWPLLLPAGAVGAAVAGSLLARCLVDVAMARVAWGLAGLALFTGALVPVLYGVPLWVALLVLVAGAAAAAGLAAYAGEAAPLAGGAALALVAFVACFADEWTTAIAFATTMVAGLVATLRGRDLVASSGAGVFLVSMGGFLWTAQHLADVETAWRAVAILVVAGLFAIARPGGPSEVPAGVVGFLAVTAAVVTPTDIEQGWLAAYLTIAGVLVTTSALVHRDRSELRWLGLALFTGAQWVRLEQLGVDTVEAYTLPLGLVLLAVGVVQMLRGDVSSARALGAGLGLALVPTMLQVVLLDPVSGRALVLGAACLLLVLVGVGLRWAAPLLAGASVGLVVVVREAAHASVVPQWAVIGVIGLALTVLGVTWERRLAELRRAATYVRGLR